MNGCDGSFRLSCAMLCNGRIQEARCLARYSRTSTVKRCSSKPLTARAHAHIISIKTRCTSPSSFLFWVMLPSRTPTP